MKVKEIKSIALELSINEQASITDSIRILQNLSCVLEYHNYEMVCGQDCDGDFTLDAYEIQSLIDGLSHILQMKEMV